MNASQLLASANGSRCVGDAPCFWCGSDASDPFKPSSMFVAWTSVSCPASRVICAGCQIAMQERMPMEGRDKPQKFRGYSWLVTAKQATPYGKGAIASLRSTCLAPPTPPWALCIAVSGQKTIYYRTPVNAHAGPIVNVLLEEERVSYSPSDLAATLELAAPIVKHVGKPALADAPSIRVYRSVRAALGSAAADQAMLWYDLADSPLGRLVAHLAPSKKELQDAA